MKFSPRPYQAMCIEEVSKRESAGLFLDMGLGKTVIMLTAAKDLPKPILVIAPLRVAQTVWPEERAQWEHLKGLRMSLVLGSPAERRAAILAPADVYVVNRENLPWLVKHVKPRWLFPTVIVDELSSFKSHDAMRFKALKAVRPRIKRLFGLTGTPAPNGLIDLWAQLWLLDQGKALGRTLTSYRDSYFDPEKRGPQGVVYSYRLKPGAAEAIYKRLESVCITVNPEGLVDLPPLMKVDRYVELSPASMALYKQLQEDFFLALKDGVVDAGSTAILINKLLQLAGGAVYGERREVCLVHDEKLAALAELVEEANGRPVLVFYSFRHELARLKVLFPDAVELKAPGAIEAWNRGQLPVVLAHPASCGHGLNLQAGGEIAIWYGLPTSLELYQQANKRLHRPGQKHPVRVFHLLAKDTRDSWVLNYVLAPKEKQQRLLLEALGRAKA